MFRVVFLIVCILIVTSQARQNRDRSGSKRKSCGRFGKLPCKARGCSYDDKETDPSYKCFRNVTRCKDSPCLNGGTCIKIRGGYQCQCPQDTFGSNCENKCIPQAISNGFSNAENRVYLDGESIEYFCNLGYRTDEDRSLVCNQGVWEPAFPPNCVKITCPQPLNITDGYFTPMNASYEVGDTVMYSCDSNHTLVGDQIIECIDDDQSEMYGSWNPSGALTGCSHNGGGQTCDSLPCLNGGICLVKDNTSGFECLCQSCCTGFTCHTLA